MCSCSRCCQLFAVSYFLEGLVLFMKQYVVDAFTDRVFAGNPAAVCVMDEWLDDAAMQNIAMENNLSETAFTVREGERWHLRWFTPGGEIDLCGHATLATAFVLMNVVDRAMLEVCFNTLSGELTVHRKGDLYEMDFPSYPLKQIPVTDEMTAAIGARPVEAWIGRDLLCVMEQAEQVRRAVPDQEKVRQLDGFLLNLTAVGDHGYDCVSRTFAPKCSVAEDPVCGSGHCHIVPYWSDRLGKTTLTAYQASRRGGTLYCEFLGDRVKLAGKAVLFAEAEIFI